jgi:1,4-alpha-glucan branching enzyme
LGFTRRRFVRFFEASDRAESKKRLFPCKVGLPRGGVWRIRFNSDWNDYSPCSRISTASTFSRRRRTSTICPSSGTIGIGPYAALMLSQDA